jgi:hypothetical protein
MKRVASVFVFVCLFSCFSSAGATSYMAGDANADSLVNAGDVVYLLGYLFRSGPPPVFWECGDPTTDCIVNAADVVYLITYLFREGPGPQIVECGWSEPVNLGPPINSTEVDESFRMTPDGSMAVWVSSRQGTLGNEDIWYSLWDSVSGMWSDPQHCGPNINSVIRDLYPSLSPDGDKLYCLLYGRPGGYEGWDIWVSTWDSLNQEWGPIENLGPPINTFYSQWSPFLSPDGLKLYFSSNGLWVSDWNGSGWDDPVSLGPNINVTATEAEAAVTLDQQTLYFTRYNYQRYICVSYWTGIEWGPVLRLAPPIDDSMGSMQPYITPDGSKLYFASGRAGGFGSSDIWVSERIAMQGERRFINRIVSLARKSR